jgi:hypothetical protein
MIFFLFWGKCFWVFLEVALGDIGFSWKKGQIERFV